ncbi:GGDEF domain-containing protein [Paucibacter sp. APW11]|uniref:Diguanylate cyclase DosC n=1 Tax=Roseateles aquae TaxID=3077235 RepID=A0ABU3PBF5_9BURK|nr:GGDEF domain-containing protein [Paucibacter sp. APW11]MDT8999101.1 GGDEF domain-containing protein [Paucibacter sp. APW11]
MAKDLDGRAQAAQLQLQSQWQSVLAQTPLDEQALLKAMVQSQAALLADQFYAAMLDDEEARAFLSHQDVEHRLHASMQRWLIELLGLWDLSRLDECLARQRHIGLVHARIRVRVDLVMRGARRIKSGLLPLLLQAGADPALAARAALTAHQLIDLAVELMSAQYGSANDAAVRTDEAYRSHAATMNMSLERERQRNALIDWENRFLQAMMTARLDAELVRIGQCSYGLWVRHKASALFSQSSELGNILQLLDRVDQVMLPLCVAELRHGALETLRHRVAEVLSELEQLRYLTDALFDQFVHLEGGRDALTQLLNRRFLAPILSREVDLCRNTGKQFSVILLDVDHFKRVNDQHGHEAGDRLLQQLANVLVDSIRSGDFLFRYGGEEFLVVGVELNAAQALQVAEKIRLAVQAEPVALGQQQQLTMTVSLGVATHDGHPDYQRLIERADQALYRAKAAGRNCCVSAEG